MNGRFCPIKEMAMAHMRITGRILSMMLLLMAVTILWGCSDDEDEGNTGNVLTDGVVWEDVTYVYALSDDDNPLSYVEYDKGSQREPVLRKTVDADMTGYVKLVLTLSGEHHIMLRIVSGDETDPSVATYVFTLTESENTYEIDLSDATQPVDLSSIIRLEWIVTPSFNNHRGWFSVSQMTFSKDGLQGPAYLNDTDEAEIKADDGTGESFLFNEIWHDPGHAFTVDHEDGLTTVTYSSLPGVDNMLTADVDTVRASLDHVNLTVRGDKGTVLLLTLQTNPVTSALLTPEYRITLNGETQHMTLFLEDLPDGAQGTVSRIGLIVNPDGQTGQTGSFEIMFAGFEETPRAERPAQTTNLYAGDGHTFSFNALWKTENAMEATFTGQEDGVLVSYRKHVRTSAVTTALAGRFSDFNFINVDITADPDTEFLFQIDTNWAYRADHHLRTDEEGRLQVSIAFGLLFFDRDIDAIDLFRITPTVNDDDAESTFVIHTAEFSNTPLVNYSVTETVPFDNWFQIGDTFTMDTGTETASWDAGEDDGTLYTRIFGTFVTGGTFARRYFRFDAVVEEEVTVTFEVDLAYYELMLTPSVTSYVFSFDSPTSGLASTWKFTEGFNLYMHVDRSAGGTLTLQNARLTNT